MQQQVHLEIGCDMFFAPKKKQTHYRKAIYYINGL